MIEHSCANCMGIYCRRKESDKYPEFCVTKDLKEEEIETIKGEYKDRNLSIMKNAAVIESSGYLKWTRVEETIRFIKKMGYKRIGIASCVSFKKEVNTFSKLLKGYGLEVIASHCKIGAIDKVDIGILEEEKIRPGGHESMCNPILQAKYLEDQRVEFIVIIGLCVGHDTLFMLNNKLPSTTMIVKDRVTGHSPAVPLYHLDGIYSRLLNIEDK